MKTNDCSRGVILANIGIDATLHSNGELVDLLNDDVSILVLLHYRCHLDVQVQWVARLLKLTLDTVLLWICTEANKSLEAHTQTMVVCWCVETSGTLVLVDELVHER